jgi:hypothetical protein
MLKLSEVAAGSLLVCEIFQLFEHTGIYIGDGLIVELQGTGLVRAISAARFLQGRSGNHLLVACNAQGRPLSSEAAASRAIAQIYSYQRYDLIRNNCHRFSVSCITGRAEPVTSFFDLKTELSLFWRTDIQWRPLSHQ